MSDRLAAALRLLERLGVPDERTAPVCRVELHFKHDRVVAQTTTIEPAVRVEDVTSTNLHRVAR